MNKFLRKCSFVLLICAGMILISFLLLLFFSPGFKKAYESSSFRNQNFELLAFGNSMALDGIDADFLTKNGISTYDFAIAGGHISTSLMQLQEYLKNNHKPKKILIGFSSATGQSLLNKVPHENPEIEFFYHPSLYSCILNPPPVNLRWLFEEMLKIVVSKDHRNSKIVLGQWRSPKNIPDTTVYHEHITKPIDYTDPYLYQIVNLCERNGIEVLLMELPGATKNRNELPFADTIKLAHSKKHLLYNLNNYKVSSQILDAKKDFLSPDHMNQFGANKITSYLVQRGIIVK